ncbi:MAG: zinc-finger domain-containing protein [Pseudomonadota bacterium]
MADDEFYLVDDRQVVITSHLHTRCDGGNDYLGHPVEYLTLEKGGETVCKYCDCRFVHADHPEAKTIRANGRDYAA